MRANEFIVEGGAGSNNGSKGKLHPHQESAMGMIHKFAGTADRIYDLNRAMMAVASSDGKTMSHEPKEESRIRRNTMASPDPKVEDDMLHHAYKSIGTPIESALSDDRSEPDDTNKVSPHKPFKGYKRK
jgi:hypothetical protein